MQTVEGDLCILEVPFDIYRVNTKQQEALTLNSMIFRLLTGWKGNFSFISYSKPLFLVDRIALLCLSLCAMPRQVAESAWFNSISNLELSCVFYSACSF